MYKLGLVCMLHKKSKKKGFSGIKALTQFKHKANEILTEATLFNLEYVLDCLKWCSNNNIKAYRVFSDIVPFQEHFDWKQNKEIISKFTELKTYAKNAKIELLIHPDQFCVLSSPNEKIVDKSIKILNYHYELCKLLDIKHIILHLGGYYNNKQETIGRFKKEFSALNPKLKRLIRLENSHFYNIEELLKIKDVDLCYDLHHQQVLTNEELTVDNHIENLKKVIEHNSNNTTVCHISSGLTTIHSKPHADYIRFDDWNKYKAVFEHFKEDKLIVEIEAKHKNLAVVKLK